MKKIMSFVIVGIFATAMVACDGGKKAAEAAAKLKADSTATADSLAQVQAEVEAMMAAKAQAIADSTAKADSVAQAIAKKESKYFLQDSLKGYRVIAFFVLLLYCFPPPGIWLVWKF